MSRTAASLALFLLAAGLEARSAEGPAIGPAWIHRKGQTRIMPLGDSITNAPGWRLELQGLLADAGYTFRYVGGRNEPCPEGRVAYHSGFSGWTIGQLPCSESFGGGDASWKDLNPELILLHIGTNDLQWGQGPQAPAALEGLLDRIWKDCPEAGIIVAQIIPFAPGSRANDNGELLDPQVEAYNAAIPLLVERKISQGRKAALATFKGRFDPTRHLADKCHPNPEGHRLMAEGFLKGIQSVTIRGEEYPPRNLAPLLQARVNGGFSAVVKDGATVQVMATIVDDDRKPAAAALSWRQAGGEGSATFSAPASAQTEVKVAGPGLHLLACTASDVELRGTSYVRVVVLDGAATPLAPGATGRSIGVVIGRTLGETELVGLIARPRWNPILIPKSMPQHLASLKDDTGRLTGASYAIEGNNFYAAKTDGGLDTPEGRFSSGGYVSTNGVNQYVRGIPFEKYDLYLYFSSAAGVSPEERQFVHKLLLRDASTNEPVAGPFYVRNLASPAGAWVRASSAWIQDLKEKTPEGNVLRIAGLTLKEINVYTGGPDESWSSRNGARSSLCGLQIVEVK
jgi:hypothetical protein